MKVKYLTPKIIEAMKANELMALQNRLKRYRKRLIVEAFRVAEEKGLDVIISESEKPMRYRHPAIKLASERDYVNPDGLIEFAKDRCPSLYRKYISQKQKYLKELDNFRKRNKNSR